MMFRLSLLGVCFVLLAVPTAQAQFIGCDPVTNPCTTTLFGLGNDPQLGPFENTGSVSHLGGIQGSCGFEELSRFQGRLKLREQDNCAVSASTRCMVEIPNADADSGYFNANRAELDFGALGQVNLGGGIFFSYQGNVAYRQLSGTCGVSGDECALDSQCDAQNAGDTCTSTCFSDPAIACSAEADAACPNLDCRTELEFDGVGTCTGDTGLCTSDADCAAITLCSSDGSTCATAADCPANPDGSGATCDAALCRDGWIQRGSATSCVCCQSQLGSVCALFGLVEHPGLFCAGTVAAPTLRYETSDWLFEGGRATRFEPEIKIAPGQQEGVCSGNRQRPCGAVGDLVAGAGEGKCTNAPPCADPLDPTNPALPSACDDVAFGGIADDFCDLSYQGLYFNDNNEIFPDPTICRGWDRVVGTPGELCSLPNDIPEGDPQPGCQLVNYGIVPQPDLNCDGIDDTTQGRCQPEGGAVCSDVALCPPCADDTDCASGNCINNGDLCPFIGEFNWFLDSNNDDIGDECQCGDGTGDGAISSPDIGAMALCANGAGAPGACDPTILDTTGDNATTAEDIGGVVAAVNGAITTSALECVRNLDTTQ